MKISHGLVPPGGWKFKQGQFTIEGDHFEDLVQNVRYHRISNIMPEGNVVDDIENQIIKQFPHLKISRGN